MKKIVSALAVLALSSGFACSQTLTAGGELTNATSITPSLGYSLYGYTGADEIQELPTFITGETTPQGGFSNSNIYVQHATSLTVDGTSYQTGELNQSGLVDTMTLGNVIPATFVLGAMINTQDVAGVGTSTQLTIDLYNSSNVLLSQIVDGTSANTSPDANDIYYTTITGAVAGDYLTFSQMAPGGTNGPSLSAITFDSSDPLSIPEPKTWALLFGGLAFLGFTVFRRRQQV